MTPDPSLRTYLIHDLGPLGVDLGAVIGRLEAGGDPSIRRALLLALGEFPASTISDEQRRLVADRLEALYVGNPDAGIHACAGWLLRRWGRDEAVRRADARAAGFGPDDNRDWYVDSHGLTFTIVRSPGEVVLGSLPYEPNFMPYEAQHLVRIERTFAIGSTEVTAGQYALFLGEHPEFRGEQILTHRVDHQDPAETIDAFQAAAFCRWLGERDGLRDDQQCFPPLPRILEARREGRLPLAPGYLKRTGYRLPTDAEWEFTCRAGSRVIRPWGRSVRMLPAYVWSGSNSGWRSHRVGELKPNDLGLFDMLGNVWEWCLDDGASSRPNFGGRPNRDDAELSAISQRVLLIVRGGAYNHSGPMLRNGYQAGYVSTVRMRSVGFRVARTIQ
jgi:formylglycine-generating enzyme required for sulfatase activity